MYNLFHYLGAVSRLVLHHPSEMVKSFSMLSCACQHPESVVNTFGLFDYWFIVSGNRVLEIAFKGRRR